jgi:hypothetical protein
VNPDEKLSGFVLTASDSESDLSLLKKLEVEETLLGIGSTRINPIAFPLRKKEVSFSSIRTASNKDD